jgi:hypothetical protein
VKLVSRANPVMHAGNNRAITGKHRPVVNLAEITSEMAIVRRAVSLIPTVNLARPMLHLRLERLASNAVHPETDRTSARADNSPRPGKDLLRPYANAVLDKSHAIARIIVQM